MKNSPYLDKARRTEAVVNHERRLDWLIFLGRYVEGMNREQFDNDKHIQNLIDDSPWTVLTVAELAGLTEEQIKAEHVAALMLWAELRRILGGTDDAG